MIPDNDSTFNFLTGILYTQSLQMLYLQTNIVHGGKLPIPVHFLMDEFANVTLPDDFDKLLSTMRSRLIFVSIIAQNLAQIKTLYGDAWESIVGDCDTLLYSGGNKQSTHRFMSGYLGKETLDTSTFGKNSGYNDNYSTNYQQADRGLPTLDKARLLDNDYCLLFLRGERPIFNKKYDLLRHSNIKATRNGGTKCYPHSVIHYVIKDWQDIPLSNSEYELFNEEDLGEYFSTFEMEQRKSL